MREPINSFKESIESIKSLHALHKHLCSLLPAIDLSEILRAEIVLIVSAFDCFIHDIVRKGVMDIFNALGMKILNMVICVFLFRQLSKCF